MSCRPLVVIAAIALVLLAACGGSGDGESDSAPGPSAPVASPTTTPVVADLPDADLVATAGGGIDGEIVYVGSDGCRLVEDALEGSKWTVSMGVRLPDGGGTALFTMSVADSGETTFDADANTGISLIGEGRLWDTTQDGGSGSAEVAKNGRSGTFDAVLGTGDGKDVTLEGEFTCGR